MNKKIDSNLDEISSNAPGLGRGRRLVKKATAANLEKAAIWYLERYASTCTNLRKVLGRRIQRSVSVHGGDPAELEAIANEIVARFERVGLLDDKAFAESRARSLFRRGKGERLVRQDLIAKGIHSELADEVIVERRERMLDEGDDPGLAAAIRYAQRRRIGPWRKDGREEFRQRDLSALGRQGHDYETARRIVDADDTDSLLEHCLDD